MHFIVSSLFYGSGYHPFKNNNYELIFSENTISVSLYRMRKHGESAVA